MDVASVNYDTAVMQPAAAQPVPAPAPTQGNDGAQAVNVKAVSNAAQAEREPQQSKAYTEDALEKTLEALNKSINTYNREMHVSVHEKTNRIMVKVMDTRENRVIREIPPEKVLDAFAKTLELAGILLDKKR